MNLFSGWIQKKEQKEDPVTQTIMNYRFPTREQLLAQTGYDDKFLYRTFWFVYANSYGLKNKEKKHTPVHYNDVATNTAYRQDESGFVLKPKGMVAAYAHDSPEDLAKKLAGKKNPAYFVPAAYVVIDTAHHLLSEDTGVDMSTILALLTNKGGLVFEPVTEYFESIAKPGVELSVEPKDLLSRLERYYRDVNIEQERISELYNRLIDRWKHVKNVVSRGHNYLPHGEKDYIIKTIDSFIIPTENRLAKDEIPKKKDFENIVGYELERVRKLLGEGKFPKIEADDGNGRLEHPVPEIVTSAGIAIYKDLYLPDLANSDGFAGREEDPLVLKNLDGRDNAARLGPLIYDAIKQFMKITELLKTDAETIKRRKNFGLGYKILEQSMYFVYNTLRGTLEDKTEGSERDVRRQTQYRPEHVGFSHMSKLLGQEWRRINRGPTLVERVSGIKLLF